MRQGRLEFLLANLDLVVLFILLMVDVRIFNGSSVASFTLMEIFVWVYCAPYVVSCLCIEGRRLPPLCQGFLLPICLYLAWILVASTVDLVFRDDSSVLQNGKNIALALGLSSFLLIRVRTIKIVSFLCNIYVLYSLVACIFGFLQYRYGGPYLFGLVSGTEYKLDIEGNVLTNPVAGLFNHPNTFALALLPAVIFAILKLVDEVFNGTCVRLITVAITVVLLAGMILSQARGESIFTAAGILFVLSPLNRVRSFTLKFLLVGILITAITVYSLHWAAETAAPGAGTVETRYLLWLTSLHAMASDIFIPLFGGGTKYVTRWSLQIAGWEFPDAHNAWLDQALYFGVPGILLYLQIWSEFFFILDRKQVKSSREEELFIKSFRAIGIAMMGDYFFGAYGNSVFTISQLFFMMSLGVRVASFGVPVSRPAKWAQGGTADIPGVKTL